MPANTPIYNFPYPLGTDPVSQGDNDIRALAEDVETVIAPIDDKLGSGVSLASGASAGSVIVADGLGGSAWVPNDSGLVLVTSGTLSSTATNFALCFPANFRNFRIVVDQVVFDTAPAELYYQFLNGTTAVNSNYRWAFLGLTANNLGKNANESSVQAQCFTGVSITSFANLVLSTLTMDVIGPNIAARTFAHTSAIGFESTNMFRYGVTMNNATTAFDGIRFLTNSAATFTGNVTVYGYRN
jgi:hypothetical protein